MDIGMKIAHHGLKTPFENLVIIRKRQDLNKNNCTASHSNLIEEDVDKSNHESFLKVTMTLMVALIKQPSRHLKYSIKKDFHQMKPIGGMVVCA